MGIVMVIIVYVPDAHPPATVIVPAHNYNFAVSDGADRGAVSGKNIGPLMNSSASPTPPIAPGATVTVIVMKGDGKAFFLQVKRVKMAKQIGDGFNNMDTGFPFIPFP